MGDLNVARPFITDLLQVDQPVGAVMHAIKASSYGFCGFGEAYFSSIKFQKTKGWKLHYKMTLNLVVPYGQIRFVVHDGNNVPKGKTQIVPLIDTVLGDENYCRLTVPPGYWVAFNGVGTGDNILMNVANIEHDPNESENKKLTFFNVYGCESFE